jgi:DNA replication protein DnaC
MLATNHSTELTRPPANIPKTTCCSKFQFLEDKDIERIEKEKRNRKRVENVVALLQRAGIRERHKQKEWCKSLSPDWDKRLEELSALIGSGMLVALIGSRGTGKTLMAVTCIRLACNRETSSLYTTAMEIFIDLRDANKIGTPERVVFQRLQSPKLLVIDEAQERGESKWEDRVLTALIDYRYSQKLDTILISNLKRAEFLQSVGSSVASRMIETGGIFECNWPSFRGAGKKLKN